MGGSRVTFTISRDGRSMPVTIEVPYSSADSGARADAHLTDPEIDLVSRSVQGLISQGITVTGDTFTIVENDSDLHTPPRAEDTARVPAAALFGASPVAGAPTAVAGGSPGSDIVPWSGPPVDGWEYGTARGAVGSGTMVRRRPGGAWERVNPSPTAPGAVVQPNPQGGNTPPPAGAGTGQPATEPERRTPTAARPARGGQPASNPPARNPFSGAGRRF